MAGVAFDILTEADLTNIAKLANYDALLFPAFNVAVVAGSLAGPALLGKLCQTASHMWWKTTNIAAARQAFTASIHTPPSGHGAMAIGAAGPRRFRAATTSCMSRRPSRPSSRRTPTS